MEAEDVVGHPLRFGRGVENLTTILLEHRDPGLEVARVIGNVARQSNHGSNRDRGQLGSKLFFRVSSRIKTAAQIAVQPRRMAAGVGELVQDDDSTLFRTVKGLVRRHLDEIEYRAVEGAITTDPHRYTARLDDDLGVLDAFGHGLDCRGGRGRLAARLNAIGITTPLELRDADPRLIRERFSVVLERMVPELRGVACIGLEEVSPDHLVAITPGRPVRGLPCYLGRLNEPLRSHAWFKRPPHWTGAIQTRSHQSILGIEPP